MLAKRIYPQGLKCPRCKKTGASHVWKFDTEFWLHRARPQRRTEHRCGYVGGWK